MKSTIAVFLACIVSMTRAFQTTSTNPWRRTIQGNPSPATFGIMTLAMNKENEKEADIETPTAMFSGSDAPETTEVFDIPTGTQRSVKWTDGDMQANTNVELSW